MTVCGDIDGEDGGDFYSRQGRRVTTGEDIDRKDRVGKEELLGSRVCSGSHSSMHSVGLKG